jgi:MFS family permease
MAANGLSHTINQVTKVAGPALGGALVAILEPKQVFLVNAGLSVIAALVLLGLPPGVPPATDKTDRGFVREFIEGLAHIRGRPLLATAIVAVAIGFLVTFLYDGLIAFLVKEIGSSLNVRCSDCCPGRRRGAWRAFAWTVWRATRPGFPAYAGIPTPL